MSYLVNGVNINTLYKSKQPTSSTLGMNNFVIETTGSEYIQSLDAGIYHLSLSYYITALGGNNWNWGEINTFNFYFKSSNKVIYFINATQTNVEGAANSTINCPGSTANDYVDSLVQWSKTLKVDNAGNAYGDSNSAVLKCTFIVPESNTNMEIFSNNGGNRIGTINFNSTITRF